MTYSLDGEKVRIRFGIRDVRETGGIIVISITKLRLFSLR